MVESKFDINSFASIAQTISFWAIETPSAIAIKDGNIQLSYAELEEKTTILANILSQNFSIIAGDLIAISMERGVSLIVAMIAVIKCRATYIPIDQYKPPLWIQEVLSESKPKIVLTDSVNFKNINYPKKLNLSTLEYELEKCFLNNNPKDTDACYVIYTSGTTGSPNGVFVNNRNLINLLSVSNMIYSFSESDTWCLFHSYSFDFSVWEIWGALAFGGRLVIAPHFTCRSPKDFYKLIKKEEITILNQTPSAFYPLQHEFIENDSTEKLKFVIFGGDRLDCSCISPWLNYFGYDKPKLFNMFGITETTIHVTYHKIALTELGISPIGFPLPSFDIKLLDDDKNLVSDGEVGEITITGPCVTAGYRFNQKLTSSRFIPDSCGTLRYYSGDLARFDKKIGYVYIGRKDQQIKFNGYRIEIGEIESAINKQDNVSQSAVVFDKKNPNAQKIIAYVILNQEKSFNTSQLRKSLRQLIPYYMLPTKIIVIKSLPLTTNSKVDREKLLSLYYNQHSEIKGVEHGY